MSDDRRPVTVLLVRHGATATTGTVLPGRAAGLRLSPAGQAQAEAAAARIGALADVRAVYASPLERAQETAAPIARATGRRVRTVEGLNECDFGDWTGRKLADLRQLVAWQQVQNVPSGFRFPGGESFAEMQTRICGTLSQLVARHRGGAVVAVSHADCIKAAVAQAVGTPLDLFQRIVISTCSVTVIAYSSHSPLVLAVNSTGDDLRTLRPS
ncbi:MAG: MSMEG_4193 family putative phosphomutase [Acidimicrobiia bacterium]|nr:MSMEG_4193 family putative phosphomutase [Acidimicrobiia bacterium]MYB25861.1 MSMEG_4193 family putative phosphomutase [Acidimicrobiia bacterium]